MTPQDVKKHANSVRKCLIKGATHYYDKKYKDLTVADLLIVLENENYHTEETILEALATLNYQYILEACKIETEESEGEYLTEELPDRRRELDDKIRGVKREEA